MAAITIHSCPAGPEQLSTARNADEACRKTLEHLKAGAEAAARA